MTGEPERQAFLEALTTSCAAPSPLRVVMTARTDMWDRVAAETGKFAMAVAPTVLHVPPLSRTDLAEVISEPARRSHLTPRGRPGRSGWSTTPAPATRCRCWPSRWPGWPPTPTTAGSRTPSTTRSGACRARSPPAPARWRPAAGPRQEVAEAILHVVSLTDAARTSGWPARDDVPPRHREILDDLVDARLVVINEVNDQQVYAPAHESLFSAWPPLVDPDREPPRRPGAARPARAAGRRLARGRRHPVRAAVRARARPGSRVARAQQRHGHADVAAYVDDLGARGSAAAGSSGPRWSSTVAALAVDPRRRPAGQRAGRAGAGPSRPGSASWPRSPSASSSTTRAAAAAALLRGLELDRGDQAAARRWRGRCCGPRPATSSARPGQATFFELGVGGSARRRHRREQLRDLGQRPRGRCALPAGRRARAPPRRPRATWRPTTSTG